MGSTKQVSKLIGFDIKKIDKNFIYNHKGMFCLFLASMKYFDFFANLN